ncbi:MAG: phage integrase N-terminal SAM-like domain-containing protein [Bacteroidota bacterium]|nr:phage integrase N-terminal SAM-like domain-containing protein [Bacteroidota bacterium]
MSPVQFWPCPLKVRQYFLKVFATANSSANTLVEAKKFLTPKSATKLIEHKLTDPTELTLSKFMPQFLEYARANYAPTTVLLYQGIVNSFIRIMGDYSIKVYTITDVEAFIAKRLKEVSPVKVNIDFRTMRALFQTACRWKMIDENPFHNVKQIKVPQERPTYISRENFSQLLNSINIPWFNIDLKRRVIFIENTKSFCIKTSKPRIIPMNDWVHKFLLLQGVPVTYVQKILGHANVTTTLIYAHQAEEHLKHAVQKIDAFIYN